MIVGIRTDANSQIGMGHLMRCMSIAGQIRNYSSVLFICSGVSCYEKIIQSGFECVLIDGKYNDLEYELGGLIDIIKVNNINKMIIDTYFVTDKYLAELKKYVRTYYIDDVNSFKYPVNFLINYNINYEEYNYESIYKNTETNLILSTKYVPLREEFQNIKLGEINSNIKNVFVSTGGSDPLGIAFILANAISKEIRFKGINFHFIIGKFSDSYEKILELKADNIILHCDVLKISTIMLKCDLAISAAGSTLYELCACGIPAIIYTFAYNQEGIANMFSKKGIMLYAGKWDGSLINNIISLINLDYGLRKKYRRNMLSVTDGKGCLRLAKIIHSS